MQKSSKQTRLVLADDHPLVRAGIRAELEKIPSVEIVGEAGNGREALELVKSQKPDVVFIDISMPELNGLEAVARIKREFPETRVIVLSMHDNEEYVWRALKSGASGYLLKKSASAEIATALKQVLAGKIYLCREISAGFLKKFPRWEQSDFKSPVEQLNERQREILQLIAEGKNTKQIAAILKLSPKTIEYHRMKLMQRLDVHDVPGLVRFALQVGLVQQDSIVGQSD